VIDLTPIIDKFEHDDSRELSLKFQSLVDRLRPLLVGKRVADVGAGTGLFM
jgi:predicted RNA methylase